MKRQYSVLILLLIGMVLIAVFLFLNRGIFSSFPPWKSSFALESPSCSVADSQGNIYVIDQTMERITKADPTGNVQFSIRSSDLETEGVYLFKELAVDSDGNLFVLGMQLEGVDVVFEEILRFSPRGKLPERVLQVAYEQQRPVRPGLLSGLNYRDGSLYYFSTAGEDEVALNKFDLTGGKQEVVYNLILPEETYLAGIDGLEPGEVYYTTLRAEVRNVTNIGEHLTVYPDLEETDKGIPFPVHVAVDPERGGAYITDIGLRKIVYLDRSGDVRTVLSQDGLGERGYAASFTATTSIKVGEDGSVAVSVGNHVILLKAGGELERVVAYLNHPASVLLFRFAVWLAALLFLFLLGWSLRLYFVEIRERRVSLITKQIAVFIPIFIVSMVFVSWYIRQDFDREYQKEVFSKLSFLVHLGSQTIDTGLVERITKPEHYMNEDFRQINAQNQAILSSNPWLDPEGLYSMLYKVENNNLYVLMFFFKRVGTYYPYDATPDYLEVAEKGCIVTGFLRDSEGEYMYALGPLYSPGGEIIGIQEVGLDTNKYNSYKTALFWKSNLTIALIAALIIAVFLFTIYYMLLSIGKLRRGVAALAAGNFDAVVPVTTRDELGELSHGFNVMAGYLRKYIAEIKDLTDACFHFVPQQFFRFLGKKSILEIELGDQVKEDLCILVTEIRSFNSLSKEMTPEENFDFINKYLKYMGPAVRNNNGIVDKYYGGGLRAIFPADADDVLRCAVEMCRELERFNEQLRFDGKEPVEIGIGIHKGPVMLGIIGEEKRMEGTAISDSVNLAAALKNLTGKYGATILITEATLNAVQEMELFPYRSLGMVVIEGISEVFRLYDVYAGDSREGQRAKQRTKTLFEEGVVLYQHGRFLDARTAFVEVIRQNHLDKAAIAYFYLCDEYFKSGAPEGWNSTLIPSIYNQSGTIGVAYELKSGSRR